MKYMLLIYGNAELWAPSHRRTMAGWSRRPTRCTGSSARRVSSSAPRAWPTRTWRSPCARRRRSRPSPTARTSRRRSTSGSFDIVDVRERGAGARDRGEDPVRSHTAGRGAAADARGRDGRVSADGRALEDLLRGLAPQVLGALVRRYGHFDACEDAVQEALLAASAASGPRPACPRTRRRGSSRSPSRRLTDALRSDESRRRREDDTRGVGGADDAARAWHPTTSPGRRATTRCTLLFLCCHPSLSPRVAARAHAAGRRRAHDRGDRARRSSSPRPRWASASAGPSSRSRPPGSEFAMPPDAELRRPARVVLHVLYLIFNEGYTATSGPDLLRPELTAEAIRLTRDGPPAAAGRRRGRRPARADAADRRAPRRRAPAPTAADPARRAGPDRWDADAIAEGVALVTTTRWPPHPSGPYQLQAAIAAVHDEAPTAGRDGLAPDPRPLRAARPRSRRTRWSR